ncbi:MAG TPA: hypothetical protein VEK08_25300 [Planctomycetota bacterium]|nr:hypothetical protein [Planctomycetota bacterium]
MRPGSISLIGVYALLLAAALAHAGSDVVVEEWRKVLEEEKKKKSAEKTAPIRVIPFLTQGSLESSATTLPQPARVETVGTGAKDLSAPDPARKTPVVSPGVRLEIAGPRELMQLDWRTQIENPDDASKPYRNLEQTRALLKFDYDTCFWQAQNVHTSTFKPDEVSGTHRPQSWVDENSFLIGRRIEKATLTYEFKKRAWEDDANRTFAKEQRSYGLSYKIMDYVQPFTAYTTGRGIDGTEGPLTIGGYNPAEWDAVKGGLKSNIARGLDWTGSVEVKDLHKREEEGLARWRLDEEVQDRMYLRTALNWEPLPKTTRINLQWNREEDLMSQAEGQNLRMGVAHRWSERFSTEVGRSVGFESRPSSAGVKTAQESIAAQYQLQRRATLMWQFDQSEKETTSPLGESSFDVQRSMRVEMKIRW